MRTFIAISLLVAFVISPSSDQAQIGTPASFEGRTIDLARDWEDAEACYADDLGAWCFRSEGELDEWLAQATHGVAAAACSGTLRLYDRTNYGSPMLALGTSTTWINLSNYSFNNRTSSYKIGACSSLFASGAHGGTPRYPSWLTVAYAQSSSMLTGWNNRISSVLHG